jgi:acetyl esterase/lipase
VEAGNGQSGTVGQELAGPIVARVTDAEGRGVSGVTVTFAASAGSGSFDPATAVTDVQGNATAAWTLGTVAGPAGATVAVEVLEPAGVSATAVPGEPAQLGFTSVPSAVIAGVVLDPPITVAVEDEHGNRVPDAGPEIQLHLNQATLAGTTTAQPVGGVATFSGIHIDAVGSGYVLTATADGLAEATSEAFAVASGPPAQLILVSGNGQEATAGELVPLPPTIEVRDDAGNPVSGILVSFEVTAGGGSLEPDEVTTDAAGRAAPDTWRLGAVGHNSLRASVATLPGVGVEFEADATAPPVAEVIVTPDRVTFLVDQTVALQAEAQDAQGQPLPDAPVAWSSSDPDVVTVGNDGTVTAVGTGTATITATSGDGSGTADVTVSLAGGTYTNIAYCTMDGEQVRMDVYIPDASKPRPLPVAVHVHGGGWTSGSKSSGSRFAEMMPLLLQRGYLVASLDYRLAPATKYPAQIQDVKCAIRHLRARASRYGLNADRIGAWGGSAGGQLVSLLGTADESAGFDDAGNFPQESSEVQAVVAISAITDFTHPEELNDDYSRAFRTWPDPESPEMIEASPVTHISPDDAPFFLIVGEDDDLVLPAQSERMHALLQGAGVSSRLLTVLNADHDLLPTDGPTDPSSGAISSRMADFFDDHLR